MMPFGRDAKLFRETHALAHGVLMYSKTSVLAKVDVSKLIGTSKLTAPTSFFWVHKQKTSNKQ